MVARLSGRKDQLTVEGDTKGKTAVGRHKDTEEKTAIGSQRLANNSYQRSARSLQHKTRENRLRNCPNIGRSGRPRIKVSQNATTVKRGLFRAVQRFAPRANGGGLRGFSPLYLCASSGCLRSRCPAVLNVDPFILRECAGRSDHFGFDGLVVIITQCSEVNLLRFFRCRA